MTSKAIKTLLLFNYGWAAIGFSRLASDTQQFSRRGFDLFSFPSNARLVWFDLDRFVNQLARQAKSQGWTAVTSQHEQFGAMAAALLAQKMGWPGTPPTAVAACQHKLYARRVLERVCPEANTDFQRLPATYGQDAPDGLAYPSFVKPIKAAFSVLAKTIHSRAELRQFIRFGVYELWVIKRLVEPFERVCQRLLPDADTAHGMIVEKPVHAQQYCLDGVVVSNVVKPLGVVDAVFYPSTQAFMRFDYPSQLHAVAQAKALDVAERFLQAIGYNHGFFNMEFFYDHATDKLTVIEFNPRMASQFADLYFRVDGIDLYGMALALAHGHDPWQVPRVNPVAAIATSSVYRVFEPTAAQLPQSIPPMPTKAQLAALQQTFPDHLLLTYPKAGHALARDFKWLGSYRYAILHMQGADAADLRARCEVASSILNWPLPYSETTLVKSAQESPSSDNPDRLEPEQQHMLPLSRRISA